MEPALQLLVGENASAELVKKNSPEGVQIKKEPVWCHADTWEEVTRAVGAGREDWFLPSCLSWIRMATADHVKVTREARCEKGASIGAFICFTRVW